jgi:glycosyltransferase involved in cell wall biosynthesis
MKVDRLCVAVDARPLAEPPNGIRRWLEGILGAISAAEQDIEWKLIVPRSGVDTPRGIDAEMVVVPGSMKTITRPIWEGFRLPGVLDRMGADVLLSPYGMVPPRCKVPTVAILHDLAFLKWPRLLPWRYRFYWRRLAKRLRHSARVVVPSRATERVVIERLGLAPSALRRVPYAADSVFSPATVEARSGVRRRLGLEGSFVLAVGTLEPRKNLGMLVGAMEILNRQRTGNPVFLVLAGRRAWAREIGGRSWLRVIEGLEDADLVALYSEASVFAMPSLDEGFGLPALEAMSCGAPVVVADAGALPEVVGEAGIKVGPDDLEGWAAALGRVLNDSRLADRLRTQSLVRARDFSWTASAVEIAEILEDVG